MTSPAGSEAISAFVYNDPFTAFLQIGQTNGWSMTQPCECRRSGRDRGAAQLLPTLKSQVSPLFDPFTCRPGEYVVVVRHCRVPVAT